MKKLFITKQIWLGLDVRIFKYSAPQIAVNKILVQSQFLSQYFL